MNKVNDWKTTLNAANKALAKQGKVITLEEFDETYTIYIEDTATSEWDVYAEGYYEDELCDLINDAWAHALPKVTHNVKELAEAYLGLTDAEKDEFLELTGNQ